jgi:hypothetical protein
MNEMINMIISSGRPGWYFPPVAEDSCGRARSSAGAEEVGGLCFDASSTGIFVVVMV